MVISGPEGPLKLIAIAALAAVFAFPADASGGIGCEAKDRRAEIDLQAGVTRGMGSPLFSLQGTATLKDRKVAADLRRTRFADDHVAQYWLDGDELRILLYRERPAGKPHGYVQLTIEAKSRGDDEGTYSGSYAVSVYDGVDDTSEARTASFEGRIRCFVE